MERQRKRHPEEEKRQNDEKETTILCKHCGRAILAANYLIHEARCELMTSRVHKPQEYEKREVRYQQPHESSQKSKKVQRKKEQVRPLNQQELFNNQQSSQKIEKKSFIKQQQTQKIPCPFCGYAQTLAELDTHPLQCEHREQECPDCGNTFPRSLMIQHHIVCRNRRPPSQNQRDQQWVNEINEHQEEQNYNPFGNFASLFMNPRRPTRQGFTVIQRNDGRGHIQRQIIFGQPQGFIRHQGQQSSVSPFANFFAILEFMASRSGKQEQGLTKDEIKSLKRFKYQENNTTKKEGEKDLCTICYCQFEKDEKLVQLKCKHTYHEECITKWVETTAKCPICKAPQTNRPIFREQQEFS